MMKTLLAATAAVALLSGVGFAETTTTTSGINTPLGGIGTTETTHHDSDRDMTIEKNKTVTHYDHDAMLGAEKDKTVTKDTSVSPDGDVTRRKTESTTIR